MNIVRRSRKGRMRWLVCCVMAVGLGLIMTKIAFAYSEQLDEPILRFFSLNNIFYYNPNSCVKDEKCVAPTGGQVTWIGDSYSVDAESIIKKKLPGITFGESVDNDKSTIQVCKFVNQDTTCAANPTNPSGIKVLKNIIEKGELKPYLVFALGTNGGWTQDSIKAFEETMKKANSNTQVVFVTSRTPGDNFGESNKLLSNLVKGNKNYHLADWNSVYDEQYFANDPEKTHPSANGGYEKWVEVVIKALPENCKDGDAVDGVATTTYDGQTIAFPLDGATKENLANISPLPCNTASGCHRGEGSNDPAFDLCLASDDKCAGASVVSMTDGVVSSFTQERNGAYCNQVGIKSSIDNTVISYMHLAGEENGIHVGQQIKAGDLIGHVSEAGSCSDNSVAHVHIDKGLDASATGGAPNDPAKRDSELVKMMNAAYAALPADETELAARGGSSSSGGSSGSSVSAGDNKNYAGEQVWSDEELKLVEEYRPVYEKAATATGIPWQILPVVHRLEYGLRTDNPSNGQCIYQLYTYTNGGVGANACPPTSGPVSTEEFQRQTNIAAEEIKGDLNAAGYDTITDDAIKWLLFSYNGQASQYINKALTLGFSAEEAKVGEGSPYVMNKYDARRDPTSGQMDPNWPGRFVADGVYSSSSVQEDFGGFVLYAALGGGTGSSSNICVSSSVPDGDLAAFVLKYAWPDYHPATFLNVMPDYKEAYDRRVGKGEYVGSLASYADCGGFVTTLLQESGFDPNYNPDKGSTYAQETYLANSSDWVLVNPSYNVPIEGEHKLSPGDVAFSSGCGSGPGGCGHTYVYVGEIPGFNAHIASASWDRRTPMAGHEAIVSEGVNWYHKVR